MKVLVKQAMLRAFPRRMVDRDVRIARAFEPESGLLADLIPAESAVFDIGANWGFYSRLAEKIVGAENVWSFEPCPTPFMYLKQWRRSEKIFPLAFSDRSGKASLRVPIIEGEARYTRSTLATGFSEEGQSASRIVEVDTTTVDEFVSAHDLPRIGFIKIDVEGHEDAVLRGAQDTLRRHEPNMLVEIEQRHHTCPITEIFRLILDLGYAGFFLDPVSRGLRPVAEFAVDVQQKQPGKKGYVQNFIFTRDATELH